MVSTIVVAHMSTQNRPFEDIRHTDEDGNEYWLARELQPLLDYARWENFETAIDKAKIACETAGYEITDHFRDVTKMVDIGSGAQRSIADIQLSRYACYLIVQNGDSSKPAIAYGQTYFAVQTRRQELADQQDFSNLTEEEQRLKLREQLSTHNKALSAAAKDCGVETPIDYAIFQDHGYRGLYGGLGAKEIHARKGLKKNHAILDHMGSTEMAANLFRATQTEEILKREDIRHKALANIKHAEVGRKVRQTIQELGGTMPENLPTPDKSIQQLEREQKKAISKN